MCDSTQQLRSLLAALAFLCVLAVDRLFLFFAG